MKKKNIILSVILCAVMIMMCGCKFPFINMGENNWPNSTNSKYKDPVQIETTDTLSDMAESLMDSCVTVAVVNSSNAITSFGSGVAVHAGGYIATNYHVVSTYIQLPTSYSIKTFLNGDMENYYATKVLWYDQRLDMSILQIQKDLPFVKMKDRVVFPATNDKLRVLEQVITIGTPIDTSLQNWTTTGNIAKLDCYSIADQNIYEDLIGHTAPINHGNSGGALFDLQGNLIGLNTLGNDNAHSIFFSVPIYPVMSIIDRVVENNESNKDLYKTPKLGVSAFDKLQANLNNNQVSFEKGLYVESVNGSPALGRLYTGDIITKIKTLAGTFNIENRNDLIYALMSANSGETITVTVTRSNIPLTVNIRL